MGFDRLLRPAGWIDPVLRLLDKYLGSIYRLHSVRSAVHVHDNDGQVSFAPGNEKRCADEGGRGGWCGLQLNPDGRGYKIV